MPDKGAISKARRIARELAKLSELLNDDIPFRGVDERSVEPLRNDLHRAQLDINNVLTELGETRVYG